MLAATSWSAWSDLPATQYRKHSSDITRARGPGGFVSAFQRALQGGDAFGDLAAIVPVFGKHARQAKLSGCIANLDEIEERGQTVGMLGFKPVKMLSHLRSVEHRLDVLGQGEEVLRVEGAYVVRLAPFPQLPRGELAHGFQ
jgi:hypothetical protein